MYLLYIVFNLFLSPQASEVEKVEIHQAHIRSAKYRINSRKSMNVNYFVFPRNFDPSKKTIVFFRDGPNFKTQFGNGPEGMTVLPNEIGVNPKEVQVMIFDWPGAARHGIKFPNLSKTETLTGFTADSVARFYAGVLKREALKEYGFWGVGLGSVMAMRTLSLVSTDPKIKVKPEFLFSDSGPMERITIEDELQAKADCPTRALASTGSDQQWKLAERYIASCSYKSIQKKAFYGKNKLNPGFSLVTPFEDIEDFVGSFSSARMGMDEMQIKDQAGCPPFDKINYNHWKFALSCGSFLPGVGPHDKSMSCRSTPFDFKKMEKGNTHLVLLNGTGECNRYQSTIERIVKMDLNENYSYINIQKNKADRGIASRKRALTKNFFKSKKCKSKQNLFVHQMFQNNYSSLKFILDKCL